MRTREGDGNSKSHVNILVPSVHTRDLKYPPLHGQLATTHTRYPGPRDPLVSHMIGFHQLVWQGPRARAEDARTRSMGLPGHGPSVDHAGPGRWCGGSRTRG